MGAPHNIKPIWLVSDGRVLASGGRATTRADRRRGLLGQDSVQQPLVIDPCNWVHSIGMKMPIESIYVDADGNVIDICHLKRWRVGPWVRHARFVVEAAPGSVERWKISLGDHIEVRDVEQ
jgi:uncharacterized membrane protein (UPF0127 family)